jgi:branched-subunit amino acid aminotransferase/4-amino-4-deoxychorismate lyase
MISIDGVLVRDEDATISVLDRGFLYGDGLFEILRTWSRRAIDLDLHLDRLCASAIELHMAVDRMAIAHAVANVIAATEGEQRLRIIVTRGQGGITARFADVRGGHTIVMAEPLLTSGDEVAQTSAAVVDYPLAHRTGHAHKTLAYLDQLVAKQLAVEAGAEEALRCAPDGTIVEGATSNIFILISGSAVTPPVAGILPGITRGHAIACCAELRVPLLVRGIARTELAAADEIFLTSAVRGIVAVTRLDGRPHGNGVGVVTKELARAYAERMRRATMPA